MSKIKITILGCGSSGGVPRVGFGWGDCDPNEPRNRRRRCALLVERIAEDGASTSVLIDAGPDLREQLLSVNCHTLDAVLLTHDHADHVHGIDDLRGIVLRQRARLPVYMDQRTSVGVFQRFGYAFHAAPQSDYPAIFRHCDLIADHPVVIQGKGGSISFCLLMCITVRLMHWVFGSVMWHIHRMCMIYPTKVLTRCKDSISGLSMLCAITNMFRISTLKMRCCGLIVLVRNKHC